MSMTVGQFKTHLTGMLHGGTLKKVRNFEQAMQRATNTMLARIDPIDTFRTMPLSNTVHDNEFSYALPNDFKKLIDLYPQDKRQLWDTANRTYAERFDLRKMLVNKSLSIEGSEGTKIIRINWKSHKPVVINQLDSVTANGTWVAAGSATNVKTDTINFVSGNGSVKFDLVATGDGIQNTTMSSIDLTTQDQVADFFYWFRIKNSVDLAKLTGVSLIWGNDLTTKYWTGVQQLLQADGTTFQVGWNQVMIPWSTATQTGTVDPSKIDSLKAYVAASGAITQINIDNVVCAVGRNFELKEYSKYVLKDSSTGAWKPLSTSDDDIIVLDDDVIQIFILETLIASAQQMEGTDSGFDVSWATTELYGPPMRRGFTTTQTGLYARYRMEYPSQSKKAIGSYGTPNMRRYNRGGYGMARFR